MIASLLFASTPPNLDHLAILRLLLQVAVLLGLARILGEVFRKIGQPAVVGELLAGLVLGPTVLGQLAPAVQNWLFPNEPFSQSLLGVLSLMGVLSLLVVTGFEIDLGLIKHKARTAMTVSGCGIVVLMISGMTLGYSLPESCLVQSDQRLVFSLFISVALSISAIPVIAKVLMDLKLLRRDIGQVTLAAAMLDDSVGWILLAVAISLAHKGHVTPGEVIQGLVTAGGVMGLGLWLGRGPMSRFLAWLGNTCPGVSPQMSAILVLAFLGGSITHALDLEAVPGTFVVGILAGQASRLMRETAHVLELMSTSFLAPIFFASAGLKINLLTLMTVERMSILLLLIFVAVVGKYVGCYIAGIFCRLSHWERLALGSGMNPRGAMGIIVATMGLNSGILTQEMYSTLVAMAIITSVLAPPLLRYTLARVDIRDEEAARLALEARAATSFVSGLRRILVPSRGGLNAEFSGELMTQLSHHHSIEVTGLVVERATPKGEKAESLQSKLLPDSRVKVVKGNDPLAVILREVSRGYDLITLGATMAKRGKEQGDTDAHTVLFNPLVDGILLNCVCPVLMTKARPSSEDESGENSSGLGSIRKILVPVVGTQYSLHATELIATVAAGLGASLTILRIIPPVEHDGILSGQRSSELARTFGEHLVDRHAVLARHLKCNVETRIEEHVAPEQVVLQIAAREEYDMIMLSCHRQPLTGRTFLGHRVETILHNAPCAVGVLSSL